MKKLLLSLGLIAALLLGTGPALAKTEWKLDPVVELDEKPIDTALTADGKKAYILTKKNILIYGVGEGRIIDTIPLEKKYNSISVAPKGDVLLLTRGSMFEKTISKITISQTFDIPIGTSPIIGPADARVTLVVFSDFQCPYCSKEFPVIEQLLKKYPNDLNVVFKHFPLRSHKFAPQASIAALAAEKQGEYLELSREMYKNYRSLNETTLNKYAKEVGLDLEKFEQDRKNKAFKQQLQRDRQLARKVGVRGVPSLYINGQAVKKRSLQGLAAMVDQELKKE
jgi:thiol-disulfide isomerase/thioredoxin